MLKAHLRNIKIKDFLLIFSSVEIKNIKQFICFFFLTSDF